MVKDYIYQDNKQIQEYIIRIKAYKSLFDKLPKLPQIQENLLRKSTLKSSLFSARIEGNSLDLNDIELGTSNSIEKKEVMQIYSALKFVHSLKSNLSIKDVYQIHSIAMDGLTTRLGKFRNEQTAIFNIAGVAIYLPPPPQKIKVLVADFLKYVNVNSSDLSRIAIAHFAFEKIHPFIDGNGRIGRILMNWQLSHIGYEFAGLLSFEEHLENNRDKYYYGLSSGGRDITYFIEFILEAVAQSCEKAILELQKIEERPEDTLLPRRSEILFLIREHTVLSFDQIKRRFLTVNPRTLHYDLEYLLKKNLIKKLGNTKGVAYVPVH